MTTQPGQEDRIDIDDPESLSRWERELDATEAQLREAVQAVGTCASDVEFHIHGVRSTTNDDRMHDAG